MADVEVDYGLGLSDDDDAGGFAASTTNRAGKKKLAPSESLGRGAGTAVSSYKDKELREQDRRHEVALARAADAKRKYMDKQRLVKDAVANLEKAEADLSELQDKHTELRARAMAVQQSPGLLMVQKKKQLAKLEHDMATLSQRIQLQTQTMEMERQVRYHAESEADLAEVELYKLRDLKAEAHAAKLETQAVLQDRAEARVKKERGAVRRMRAVHADRNKAAAAAAAEVGEEYDRRAAEAVRLRKQALRRAKESNARQKVIIDTAAEVAKERRARRVKAVLDLKKSTEVAASDVKGANERRAKAAKVRAKREAKEAVSILADGGNPYEVFRARDRDKDVATQIRRHKESVATTKLKLTDTVLREEESKRKEEAIERRNKEYAKAYQASLSRPVQEARVAEFIRQRTRGGVDVLDPTGREIRIQPSQVTTIKDFGFGLGKHATSRPDIVDKVGSKKHNQSVEVDPRWMPKATVTFADDDDDQDGASGLRATSASRGGLGSTAASRSSSSSSNNNLDAPKPRIVLREPSKLEKDIMAAARARQRANIVKKQVVLGREYKGTGFLPAPATIDFKDFDVGKPMKIRMVLTNVSLTFNSFKILPLPPAVRDFFEIKFTPPGRMSAGMTCPINIRFVPRTSDDIHTCLKVLAQTGPIDIPLIATCKKAVPEVLTPVVDVGTVTMGETRTTPLKLKNKGALNVGVAVSRLPFDDEVGRQSDVSFPPAVSLSAYSPLSIPFKFAPTVEGPVEVAVELEYDNPSCQPHQVLVKAVGAPPPLYVDESLIDLQCCVYDKLYRTVVVVKNRGTTALKCLTSVPPPLRGVLEFIPDMFYIQAGDKATGAPGTFSVSVKFRPTAAMMTRRSMQQFIATLDDATFVRVPLALTSPDQVLPVEFDIAAQLTASDVVVDPPALDFGRCLTTQSTALTVSVTNTSDLPQKFGFVKLPQEVQVEPSQGFGVLLPRETVTRRVLFSPVSATDHRFSLTIATSMNKVIRLPVTGTGVSPPLRASHSVIKLGASVVGEVVDASVYLKNVTTEDVSFEFIPPPRDACQLTVSPVVGTLAPGAEARCVIEFTPKDDPNEPKTPPSAAAVTDEADEKKLAEGEGGGDEEGGDAGADADGKEGGAEGGGGSGGDAGGEEESKTELVADESIPPHVGSVVFSRAKSSSEPWSRHAQWFIPCFMQRASEPSPDGDRTVADAMVVHVSTTTVKSKIRLDRPRIDFGQVSVGQSELTKLRIWNDSKTAVDLVWTGLNPAGSLTFLNAPRSVAPGGYQDLVVQFRPTGNKRFVETPTVSTSTRGAAFEVVLAGQGVSPSLELDPADGQVAMGHVMAGDSTSQTVTLRNTSVFPLKYTLVNRARPHTNYNGTEVFTATPPEASIPAGGSQEITVSFAPDHPSRSEFLAAFRVVVPNQVQEHVIVSRGRAWGRQVYVTPSLKLDELEASAPSMQGALTMAPLGVTVAADDGGTADASPNPYTLKLEFPKPTTDGADGDADTMELTKEVTVGCVTRPDGRESSGGAYEVTLPADDPTVKAGWFAVDNPKGAVAAGSTQTVTFKFKPPAVRSAADAGELDVGQWAECAVPVVISGGAVVAGVPDKQTVVVLLRGFVYV